ncbi:MAG: type II toxin-antitoxin system RelE/ParE family toxin [Ghiorsea sp.]
MINEVKSTPIFTKWVKKLKDRQAAVAIAHRIDRVTAGNLGDVKSVGEGVHELRIHVGAGYRVYFCNQGETIIFLLCGGDKSNQQKDIEKAKMLAKEVKS